MDSAASGLISTAPVRPRWWTQVMVMCTVWWCYDAINNLAPLRRATAFANGLAILQAETSLHLDAEPGLNRWLADHLRVGRWVGTYYNLAHFSVTIAVLVWVWWRHPDRYRPLRNVLLGTSLIGFVVFWAYPVAPPRMLSQFTDVVLVSSSSGSWVNGPLASQANEFAAMPSLHVAWALWCAGAVWAVRKDRPARGLASGHAVLTSIAVVATANHYVLDVVAGVGTTAVASLIIFLPLVRLVEAPCFQPGLIVWANRGSRV